MDRKGDNIVKLALWVRLEAKPGKEAPRSKISSRRSADRCARWSRPRRPGLRIRQLRIQARSVLFDAFPDEAGRQAHLTGKVAAALKRKGIRSICQAAGDFRKSMSSRPTAFLTLMPKMGGKSGVRTVRWICTISPTRARSPPVSHQRFGLRIGVLGRRFLDALAAEREVIVIDLTGFRETQPLP